MADPHELMIRFVRGHSEDDARSAVTAFGHVRRRMRTDHADQVMLLLRVDGDPAAAEAALGAHPAIEYIEKNVGGFSIKS